MKKTIIILAFSLAAMSSSAQKLTVASAVVDMGQVQYRTPTSGVFSLKNSGRKPLTITKVDTGCGCAVATYPATPIASGGEFTIKVTYDARMMGHFDKVIEVFTDASTSPLQLDLRGVVVEEVTDYIGNFPFKLGTLTADCNYIEFEDVHLGTVIQQKFHIYNPTSKDVQPTIMHLPNYLRADISPSTLTPHHSSEVTITLDSRLVNDYGLKQTEVYLGANPGEKVSQSKEIGISAVLLPAIAEMTDAQKALAPRLQMSATKLDLPTTDGKKKTGVIDLQNIGRTRLDVQKLEMFTAGLEVQLNKTSLDPGEMAKMKISTNPRMLKGVKAVPRILMITNDPDNPKVIIEVNVK